MIVDNDVFFAALDLISEQLKYIAFLLKTIVELIAMGYFAVIVHSLWFRK